MSNASEIGARLVALCQEGRNLDAIQELYAADVVSVEAAAAEGFPREMAGLEAVIGKSKWWTENHEIHSAQVAGPYPHGDDRFAVRFEYDVTNKPSGQRYNMDEVGVYTITDGKISREEFFYAQG